MKWKRFMDLRLICLYSFDEMFQYISSLIIFKLQLNLHWNPSNEIAIQMLQNSYWMSSALVTGLSTVVEKET